MGNGSLNQVEIKLTQLEIFYSFSVLTTTLFLLMFAVGISKIRGTVANGKRGIPFGRSFSVESVYIFLYDAEGPSIRSILTAVGSEVFRSSGVTSLV